MLTSNLHCEAVRGGGDGLCDWVVRTEPSLDGLLSLLGSELSARAGLGQSLALTSCAP